MADRITKPTDHLQVIKNALLHFNASDGYAMVSYIALSIMIAVFPFLVFAVSLAGATGSDGVAGRIVDLVFDYWPDAITAPIVKEINAVIETTSTQFLTIGIVLALFLTTDTSVSRRRLGLCRRFDRRHR